MGSAAGFLWECTAYQWNTLKYDDNVGVNGTKVI